MPLAAHAAQIRKQIAALVKPSSPTLLPKGEGSRTIEFLREHRLSHQILVNSLRGTSSIRNGPDDQGLPTGHVAGGKDFRHGGHLLLINLNIAALVDQHS